ncbi:galactokinase [Ruminococcaceae bacterium YRB3002]|nr:galactokinase [Ruminococcaceae bacterium YRB3002]
MITASALVKELSEGAIDSILSDIDPDTFRLNYERERYINAVQEFISLFGDQEVSVFSAPGRSEICGNHTDHQLGKVLACSINRDAIAVASPRRDGVIRLKSDNDSIIETDISNIEITPALYGTTTALINGVIRGISNYGYNIGGFDCYVTSDVLIGAGLSSSAAFETLIGTVVNGFYNDMAITAVEIAKIGQYAENAHFGKPCGLMDQMACSVGSLVYIDFGAENAPYVEKLELDLSAQGMSLCITNTKGSHANLTDEYAAIPDEMNSVAAYYGEEHLNTVDETRFLDDINDIRAELGDRAVLRAMHYWDECRRVEEIVQAVKNDNMAAFLHLVKSSGDSSFKYLQNVYPNSDVMHQNISVALMMSDRVLAGSRGVARVHGGGFAGTIQAFVKDHAVSDYVKYMDLLFGDGSCAVLKIRKYGGLRVV